MITRTLGKQDYDHIVQVIDRWWGGPTSALAHPIFFYELGQLARVVEHDGIFVGFLLRISGAGASEDRVRASGGHPSGLPHAGASARCSIRASRKTAAPAGCTRLKAITTVGNEGSIAFHQATGWTVTTVDDYAGPARPRMVFNKVLAQ